MQRKTTTGEKYSGTILVYIANKNTNNKNRKIIRDTPISQIFLSNDKNRILKYCWYIIKWSYTLNPPFFKIIKKGDFVKFQLINGALG